MRLRKCDGIPSKVLNLVHYEVARLTDLAAHSKGDAYGAGYLGLSKGWKAATEKKLPEGQIEPYVRVSVRNALKDHVRFEQRQQERFPLCSFSLDRTSTRSRPLFQLEWREFIEFKVPEGPLREVILLILDGHSVAEVAALLGITRQAVYHRLKRLRPRFEKVL